MDDEKADPLVQAQMANLDASICEKIGNLVSEKELDAALMGLFPHVPGNVFLQDLEDDLEPAELDSTMPESNVYTPEAYDEYLMVEVLLPNGGDVTRAKVIGRKRDADGNPAGRRHSNSILDTCEYEVQFPDGATNVFTVNIIACIHRLTVMGIPSSG
jgi:hypothetical protein